MNSARQILVTCIVSTAAIALSLNARSEVKLHVDLDQFKKGEAIPHRQYMESICETACKVGQKYMRFVGAVSGLSKKTITRLKRKGLSHILAAPPQAMLSQNLAEIIDHLEKVLPELQRAVAPASILSSAGSEKTFIETLQFLLVRYSEELLTWVSASNEDRLMRISSEKVVYAEQGIENFTEDQLNNSLCTREHPSNAKAVKACVEDLELAGSVEAIATGVVEQLYVGIQESKSDASAPGNDADGIFAEITLRLGSLN